jgi:CheY-like chemotaxis protein
MGAGDAGLRLLFIPESRVRRRLTQLVRPIDAVNILYLENHAVFAEQVVRQFLSAHQVTVVPSLAAARSALGSRNFDLILSDYDLDDGKGAEFVRECRTSHSHVPVIAVSSHKEGNDALVEAGACAVCGKMQFNRIQQVIGGLGHEAS